MFQKLLIISLFIITLITTASAIYYSADLSRYKSQKHINDKKTIKLVRELSLLAKDIRIVTYPTACDRETINIAGDCDVGNYMEWAGPEMQQQVEALLSSLEHRHVLTDD